MSKENKYIDKIIKEKLIDAEAEPPFAVWNRLAETLDQKDSKKKVFLFRRLSAAAILVLLLSLGVIFLLPPSITKQDSLTSQIITDSIKTKKAENSISVVDLIKLKPKLAEEIFRHTDIHKTANISLKNPISKKKNKIKELSFIKNYTIKENLGDRSLVVENNLTYQVKPNDDWSQYEISTPEKKRNINRWEIGMGVSPVYASLKASNNSDNFNSNPLTSGATYSSAIQDDLSNLREKLIPTATFGINFSYNLTDKWSLVSGINYLDQKNEIDNFYITENNVYLEDSYTAKYSFGNINIFNNASLFRAAEASNSDLLFQGASSEEIFTFRDSKLIQSLKFLEIPLLLSYKVINNKYTVAVLGGVNAAFLVDNSVYIKGYPSEDLGNTEDVNSLTFKSVLGLSVEYPIGKRVFITFSPTYKYQLTDINKVSDQKYKLEFFDITTGISYRF